MGGSRCRATWARVVLKISAVEMVDFILREHGLGVGPASTHSLPVRAQPLLGVQHVVDAAAIALQQVLPSLLPSAGALAGGEGQILPAAFLALQDPVMRKGNKRKSVPALARGAILSITYEGETKPLGFRPACLPPSITGCLRLASFLVPFCTLDTSHDIPGLWLCWEHPLPISSSLLSQKQLV